MTKMIPFPGQPPDEREDRTVMAPLARMHLRALSGALRGRDFPFAGDAIIIGRAATCTIAIPNHGVSRVHARIEYADGGYWVIPEKTVNGTRVNEVLIQEPTQLREGHRIAIEDTTFLVSLQGPPSDLMDDPIAPPPSRHAPLGQSDMPPVRLSAPTIATQRAPRPSAPQMIPPYPPIQSIAPPRPTAPQLATTYPVAPPSWVPNAYQAPFPPYPSPPSAPGRKRPRWGLAAALVAGLLALVIGVVLATVKLVAKPPALAPVVTATPAPAPTPTALPPPVATPTPAPTPPVPVPTPPAPVAVAAAPTPAAPPPPPPKPAPKLVGTLVLEHTDVLAGAHGTVVDVAATNSLIEANAPIAHVRLDSAAYDRASAKLAALRKKYGNSPDYADFIAQARGDVAAAARARETRMIAAPARGVVTVSIKPGDEVTATTVVAAVAVARLTVPAGAVAGTGKYCTAELVSTGKKLAGVLLDIGAAERTLELDAVAADLPPGDVGEVRVSCAGKP